MSKKGSMRFRYDAHSSSERGARGCGDHRAHLPIAACSTTRASAARCIRRRRDWLGHDLRHRPPRTVRIDRGARAASPRRHECRLRCFRRRRSRAQARQGCRLPRGRYISAEASARGEWKPGGATQPGFDAYATSKQANLAAARCSPVRLLGCASTHSNRALYRTPASRGGTASSWAS